MLKYRDACSNLRPERMKFLFFRTWLFQRIVVTTGLTLAGNSSNTWPRGLARQPARPSQTNLSRGSPVQRIKEEGG